MDVVAIDSAFSEDEVQVVDMETPKELVAQDQLSQLCQRQFQNREEFLNAIQSIVSKQGYAISIKKSKRDKLVVIGCDKGGVYRNRLNLSMEDRKRKTASRLINCPFEVQGKRKADGLWFAVVVNASHNHDPSVEMSGHPSYRHFSKEHITRIKEMSSSGIPPRQILTSLRQHNPKLPAVSRTLYNLKAKIRKDYLAGRTMIQALLEELGKGGFKYTVEYDSDGHLTHLIVAHPTSMVLTRSYSSVFVMDCTYKTNRYKMALLDIVGVSSFNTSFHSCFVFLRNEEVGDYIWALKMFSNMLHVDCQPSVIVSDRELALMKAIKLVFPRTFNLLCVWHIEKIISSKCKPHFKEGEDWTTFLNDWTSIINSTSELEYHEMLQSFEAQYKEKELAINYIKNTWLPLKEHFVSAWTEMHSHFGNRVTSRAEGAHAILKKYLQVSTGDLCEVKNKICLAIENQFHEIKAQLSSEQIQVPHHFHIPLFRELVTRVSVFALDQLFKQCEIAKSDELLACKGHFMKTMGLPCAHKIRNMKHEALHIDDIHPQWRLDIRSFVESEIFEGNEDNQSRGLHEPNIESLKGRPSSSKSTGGTSSTGLDPSAFEIVERTRKSSNDIGLNVDSMISSTNLGGSTGNMVDLNTPINSVNDSLGG